MSTKDGNGYTDVVKNANQVDFKGTGLATVTGETDKESGIRTITVNVDAQKTVEAAQTPVVYTNKAGDKLVKIGDKFYKAGDVVNGKPKENAQEVPKGDVIASMNNGDNNTSKPMQLSNIGSNLQTVNDTNKQVFDPNSTTPKADKNNKSAPMTATEAAELLDPKSNKFAGNNAATVSDVLNAGWNLQGNGSAVDFVKPFDTVNFVNGKGTKAVVETGDNLTSTVKFDVDAGEITSNTNGSVNGPTTAENAKKLAEDLAAAQKALNDLPADADDAAKKKAQDALKTAQDAAAPLNKVATAQNVADMINNSGFTLKTSNVEGGEKDTTSTGDEVINPGKAVEMVAGKNLTVKQEANGKVTYSTKDNVEFTSVKIGEDKDGKKPVNFTTEAASPASNNGTDKTPTTALNISSSDGKPTQLKGVGSVLNTEAQPTSTGKQGDTPATAGNQNLVNLGNDPITGKSNLGSDILNSAATVGDLANMGWVVSTKDGNDYKDVVKNANQVDFKGGAGISVEGKTTTNGVREITISVKDGEVVKPNQFTAKVNGTDTPVTKVGDQYYNTADIDPKTGEPKANVTPVTPDEGTTPTNAGNGYVTGNKVAAAIQKSGFVVGKQKDALSAADFKDEVKDEKVNPDDELRFADGNNTKVKLATKESVDKDGNKVTTTTVKVDVTGLPVQYTDKNGTPVTKVGDKYFTVGDTATEVKPADLTTNMVNPAAAPNVIGAPTTLGNVKSNLPSVNDVGKDNKSAPITAEKAADIVNKAGNNAATVSDVLNAGWNLKNNDEARDFVKPYDTVDFINGKGTVAVVETADDATSSTVKFDVDAGEITAETKDGKATGKVVGLVPADKKPADLLKAVEDAQKAVDKLAKDAAVTPEAKKAAQDALKAAQDAAAPLNKVATAQNVADMINASGFTLKTSATADGKKESGNDEIINPGKAVEMVAGKNLTVTQDKNGKVTYATANDVNFNSLSLGTSPHAPTLSADEDGSLRLGSKGNQAPVRISNVAPGIKDGDAVNVSQLKGVTKDLEDKIDGVAAGSNAAASLPQVYLPGKSMVAASVGTYGSQGALAVGYSSISDNGKWLIKGQVNVNTKAKTGGGVGVGYLW
ncbi:YadA-like family protein [Neisseria cinerea]